MNRPTMLGAALLMAASLLQPAPAQEGMAAPLRAGEYDCGAGAGTLGRIDIAGETYRFRPYGKAKDRFAPYQTGGDGSIRWEGHMGALDRAPSALVDSMRTPQGFDIRYRVRPGAPIDTMRCHAVR